MDPERDAGGEYVVHGCDGRIQDGQKKDGRDVLVREVHYRRSGVDTVYTRLFSSYFQGPKFYNSLNSVITGSSSSASFKRKLKEFFLSMY